MRASIRRLSSVTALLLLFTPSLPAIAQNTPRLEVSGGYQWLDRDDQDALSVGFYGDAAYNVNKWIAVVGQVGNGYDRREFFADEGVINGMSANLWEHDFMGGVRFNDRQGSRTLWFAQFLVGGAQLSVDATFTGSDRGSQFTTTSVFSQTYRALQYGWGVCVFPSRAVGLRVGADRLSIYHEGDWANMFKLTAGVVLPLARR